jgi:hypothetical protein
MNDHYPAKSDSELRTAAQSIITLKSCVAMDDGELATVRKLELKISETLRFRARVARMTEQTGGRSIDMP